ncbi:MAG: rod shape-determining protein [Christensenellaceae bacterium]|jgi:actin-like ATPase involved in cell morphogenesis|nr:rod shape-determining protein [Christensenellaceae bacterium]
MEDYAGQFQGNNFVLYKNNVGIIFNGFVDEKKIAKEIKGICPDIRQLFLVVTPNILRSGQAETAGMGRSGTFDLSKSENNKSRMTRHGTNLNAVRNLMSNGELGRVILLQPSVCLASFAGYTFDSPTSIFVVVIGEFGTDIAIITGENIVSGWTLNSGTDDIIETIAKNYELNRDDAALVLDEVASLVPNDMRHLKVGKFDIAGEDIRPIVSAFYEDIFGAINKVLNKASLAEIQDIKKGGVYIGGVGASIRGLKEAITAVLGIECFVSNEKDNDLIYGAGVMLDKSEKLMRVAKKS